MTGKNDQPKQSPQAEPSFTAAIIKLLQERGWNAARLGQESNLSKTTISRMLRNSNDKGSTYQPTVNAVTAIALALGLAEDEWKELLRTAFPEFAIWHQGFQKHIGVHDVNEQLYEQGLPLLGNANDE